MDIETQYNCIKAFEKVRLIINEKRKDFPLIPTTFAISICCNGGVSFRGYESGVHHYGCDINKPIDVYKAVSIYLCRYFQTYLDFTYSDEENPLIKYIEEEGLSMTAGIRKLMDTINECYIKFWKAQQDV